MGQSLDRLIIVQLIIHLSRLPKSKISATGSRKILQKRCGKVTGSCRKTPKFPGTQKQYSDLKLSGFFPGDSCQLPVRSDRNRPQIIGKSLKKFLA